MKKNIKKIYLEYRKLLKKHRHCLVITVVNSLLLALSDMKPTDEEFVALCETVRQIYERCILRECNCNTIATIVVDAYYGIYRGNRIILTKEELFNYSKVDEVFRCYIQSL